MVFEGLAPTSRVPEAVLSTRAWGAAGATVAVVILLALATWVAAFRAPAPSADPTSVATAGLPEDVVAALSSLEERDAPCRSWTPDGGFGEGPAPCAAAATIVLPDAHPYHRWQISCGSTSTPPPVTGGPLQRGVDRVVVIPDVPPTPCRVTLAGPGSPPVTVRAGSRVTCRLEGNLVCDR